MVVIEYLDSWIFGGRCVTGKAIGFSNDPRHPHRRGSCLQRARIRVASFRRSCLDVKLRYIVAFPLGFQYFFLVLTR